MTYAAQHLPQIGAMTLQHLMLVACGLLLALAIAVPLGIFVSRKPRAATPVFAAASVIYVIPSLALLAVAVRYLGLGAVPVILVLAAYAQFMLVRSIAAGLAAVPRAQREAADGLGFTSWQRLRRVEFPQALPVLLGGLRLAAVASIAIATLGGYVGAGGLGSEIFLGLQRKFIDETLAGSVPAAILAIIADAALRLAERKSRSRWAS